MQTIPPDDGSTPWEAYEKLNIQDPLDGADGCRDISSSFLQAATCDSDHLLVHSELSLLILSALAIGKLVQDASFTLFEAVGALEIMDPKMDSGITGDPVTPADDEFDVHQDLSAYELIGVMDELLAFEMSWHMGTSLSQSLLTSHYIDHLLSRGSVGLDALNFEFEARAESQKPSMRTILRAYCLALIKTCGLAHHTISNGSFYEEEDFNGNLFNKDLLNDVGCFAIRDLLHDAILKFASDGLAKDDDAWDAISTRLMLRDSMLVAFDPETEATQACSAWHDCADLISRIRDQHDLAIPLEDSYSVSVQRRLASTSPPRPIIKPDFQVALDVLTNMSISCRDSYTILEYQDPITTQNVLLAFHFKSPEPTVYSRALIQSLLHDDICILRSISSRRFLLDGLGQNTIAMDELLTICGQIEDGNLAPTSQLHRYVEDFLSSAREPFFDPFLALSMNKSRVRRVLCNRITEWEQVEVKAAILDQELSNRAMSRSSKKDTDTVEEQPQTVTDWTFDQKLQIMQWIVQIGFGTDIYQTHELCSMYWLLQYFASVRINTIRAIYSQSQDVLRAQGISTERDEPDGVPPKMEYLQYIETENSATRNLADGLSSLYSFVAYIGLISQPYANFPLSDPRLLYRLRMRPFAGISYPDLPTYDQLLSLISTSSAKPASEEACPTDRLMTKSKALDLLTIAGSYIQDARLLWDQVTKVAAVTARQNKSEQYWRQSSKGSLKSCIAASIAVATAKKAVEQVSIAEVSRKLTVEIPASDVRYHQWWIVPKFTMS